MRFFNHPPPFSNAFSKKCVALIITIDLFLFCPSPDSNKLVSKMQKHFIAEGWGTFLF